MNKAGTVFWITGLSGSGKTTIASSLLKKLKTKGCNVILLDGDRLREILGSSFSYSLGDRKELSEIYARLCKFLSEEGLDIICATISMFDSTRQWNRNNIKNYKEIYLKVSRATLLERDQKKLYSNSRNGNKTNVIGEDLGFEEPKTSDLVVNNDGSKSVEVIVDEILNLQILKAVGKEV